MNQTTLQRSSRPRGRTGTCSRSDRAPGVLVKVELGTGGSALLCGGLLALRPDGAGVVGLAVGAGTPLVNAGSMNMDPPIPRAGSV